MVELTDAEVDAALERGRIAKQSEPRAHACRYDAVTRRIVVELTNGCVFAFPADLGQGLEQASDEHLAQVEIFGGRSGLYWERSILIFLCRACWRACSQHVLIWRNKAVARPRMPKPRQLGQTA